MCRTGVAPQTGGISSNLRTSFEEIVDAFPFSIVPLGQVRLVPESVVVQLIVVVVVQPTTAIRLYFFSSVIILLDSVGHWKLVVTPTPDSSISYVVMAMILLVAYWLLVLESSVECRVE